MSKALENMTKEQLQELVLEQQYKIQFINNEKAGFTHEINHLKRRVQVRTTLPKSPFVKALIYSVSRWDNLMNYLSDGHLEIDNNLVENAIRPTALEKRIISLPDPMPVHKVPLCSIHSSGPPNTTMWIHSLG